MPEATTQDAIDKWIIQLAEMRTSLDNYLYSRDGANDLDVDVTYDALQDIRALEHELATLHRELR